MAIQLPNPGLGDGQTGDNEFVMWTKVKDNFSNTTHAASRLIGEETGNVLTVGAFGVGNVFKNVANQDVHSYEWRTGFYMGNNLTNAPLPAHADRWWYVMAQVHIRGSYHVLHFTEMSTNLEWIYSKRGSTWQGPFKKYTEANTTKEQSTNYIKSSSPVLKLRNDGFTKEHEAEKLDIAVNHKSVGVYEITGTTGLRNDGTWYFSPPKDEHNNVLCMVEVSEKNKVVTVKTYKKRFDFETVSIVPDYDNPTDIPEGAEVMLRFNDLPQEQLDEPIE